MDPCIGITWGTCEIMLLEAEKGKVLPVKEGDALSLPFGIVIWWFNPNDAELVTRVLGDTSKGHKAGKLTNF